MFARSSLQGWSKAVNKELPCCLQNQLELGRAEDWCCLGYPVNNPFKMAEEPDGVGRGWHLP